MLLCRLGFFCHPYLPWLHGVDQKLHNHTHAAGWETPSSLMKATRSFPYTPWRAAVYQTAPFQSNAGSIHTTSDESDQSYRSQRTFGLQSLLHNRKPKQAALVTHKTEPQSGTPMQISYRKQDITKKTNLGLLSFGYEAEGRKFIIILPGWAVPAGLWVRHPHIYSLHIPKGGHFVSSMR